MAEPARSWTLAVRGDSMRFLLKAGDRILVRRAPLSALRAGDLAVVLDWREGPPEYVVHRLLGRLRRAGVLCAVTKGDANLLPDPLSPERSVVGVVEAARVGGVWRSLGPEGRGWGLALAALGAPVYRGLAAADRLCEAALRLGWMRLPLSRPARGALLGLLAWRERAASGAYARLQALGERLTCGAEVAAPPESDAARTVFGILDGDQSWSGRIQVDGDVFVPPGATLRVEPGTEIVFRADSQWDCLRECRIWKGWPQDLEGKCRILIGGRLLAEGTAAAPISFGGADWAGIHFVTDSWGSSLINVRAVGSLCAAVTLHDSAQAALKLSRLSDCESGVVLLGRGASAALEDCRVERCRRRGLSSGGGRLSARRTVVADCGEIGVFAEDAELELEDCALTGTPVGLGQNGGSARLTRVSAAGAAKAGFELDGGTHELRGISAADCGEALSFGGGRLSLEGFEASGCGSGVTQRSGELSWSGGRVQGGRFGLESAGSAARVEGVSFRDQTIAGCRMSGGALTLRGGSVRGGGGLAISPGVAARVEDVALETGSGVLGVIDGDRTWSGRVSVQGDVFVPPGATLRVEPGTEIVFRADSQWDCLTESRLWTAGPQDLEGKCRILIGGRLLAEGTAAAPISFGGAGWAGLHFANGSRDSSLIHVSADGSLRAAVTLHGSAQAALKLSRLSDCESGVVLLGRGASAALEDCRVERCRRRGLSSGGGRLSARRTVVADCGEIGVFAEDAELELEDCALTGTPVGLGQNGGSARLTRVSAAGAAKAGFELDGGTHELRGISAADCGEALSFGGGRLSLEGFEASGCGSGVTQRSGELSWSGGRVQGGRFGLESAGSAARVEGVSFREQTIAGCRMLGGALTLRGVRVERAALGVGAAGALDAEDVGVEGCARGVEVSTGPLKWRGGFLRGGGGLAVSPGVAASVEDAAFEPGSGDAAVRAAGARLEIRRASFEGGEGGVLAEGGSTRLDDCSWRGQSGAAVFQNGGELAIFGGVVSGPGSGVRVAAGRLEIDGARLEGPRLSLECAGAAVISGVELAGGDGGARFEGTSFELSRLRVSGARGVELARGRLVWRAGRLAGGGLAIGPGAEAELQDVVVEDVAGHGAALAGGRLAASRCRFEDVAEAGVYVSGGGAAALTDCSLRRLRYGVGAPDGDTRLEDVRITEASAVAFTAESGRHRLTRVAFHGCADRVHAAGGAIVEIVEDPPAGRGAVAAFKRALRAAVLRTRRLPLFGAAYRAAYGLPVRALRLWAARDGNAAALYAHRSWARRDWDPGLSDVDLLVAARDLSGETGRRWLERFWSRFGLLKGAFPFLGECLVAEPAEFAGYARWGGFRARGFAEQLAPLYGRPPLAQARPASPKAALEPLGELAHAYTRLMASSLWRPEASRAGRSAARNAALDVVRLCAAGADGGPAELAPREAALAAAGPAAAALRAPLEALAAAESPRARAELCAAGLSRLHDGAARALASWPAAGASSLRWISAEMESSSAGNVELGRRRGLAEEYARACGGALVAGCADDLYRTCLVLDDGAASPGTLPGVFEALSRLVSLRGEPATLPIVLTVSAWKVWSRLAYLESPVRFLESGDGPGDVLIRAGAPLPGAWQYAWGRERLAPVETPDALVIDLARESLATLRCAWRWQACEASSLSRGYVQHYLLGRAMGLRLLLERGVGASFFALDPLRALYAREFPERAAGLESLWARLTERDGPAPWTELYAWVDGELRG